MSQKSSFVCPFCGLPGKKTKEHVWAQWMHKSAAASWLISQGTGRRFERNRIRVEIDADGRFVLNDTDRIRVNELLPHVQVPVCRSCNTGWMSSLENQVQATLRPWTRAGLPIRLSPHDQELIASWATKSWMAYALTFGDLKNPFTRDEYRASELRTGALERARVWIFYSESPTAQVSMALHSSLVTMTGEVPNLTKVPDNCGYGLLAFSGLVVFMALAPPEKPELLEAMDFEVLSTPGIIRAWPPSRSETFPQLSVEPERLSDVMAIPSGFDKALGLPVLGLTKQEAREARRAFLAGAEPFQIRARWAPQELAQLVRARVELDPHGYGLGLEANRTLGGVAWHGRDYVRAVAHYKTARSNGATIAQIGSQLCDALMFDGQYEAAAEVSQEIEDAGRNEWQDEFRMAILYELVNQHGIRAQTRRVGLRFRQETLRPTWKSVRIHLKSTDALDPRLWQFAVDTFQRLSLSTLMTAAYLTGSPAQWMALVHYVTSHDGCEPIATATEDALVDDPDLLAVCLALLEALGTPEEDRSFELLGRASSRARP